MLLAARCALNLYECALSTSNADFRLYEFLKNSRCPRLSKNLLIDGYRSTSKHPDCSRFFDVERVALPIGGG
jgi:hypothetical protein